MRCYVYAVAAAVPCYTRRRKDIFADAHPDIDMRADFAVAVRTFVRCARCRHIVTCNLNARTRASARNGCRMCRIRRGMCAAIKTFAHKTRISQAISRLDRFDAHGAAVRRTHSCSLLYGKLFVFRVGKRLFCRIASRNSVTVAARTADRPRARARRAVRQTRVDNSRTKGEKRWISSYSKIFTHLQSVSPI